MFSSYFGAVVGRLGRGGGLIVVVVDEDVVIFVAWLGIVLVGSGKLLASFDRCGVMDLCDCDCD